MEDKVNILIVEDEGIVALSLEDTLQMEGYQVAGIADNGKEALRILKKGVVDLLLLDIQIKGDWDGIETARQLTAVKDIPFIYLTAFSDDETVKRAKDTTPAAYLVKPYQSRNLLIAIDIALHNFAFRKANPSRIIPLYPNKPAHIPGQKEGILCFNDAIFIKQNSKFNKVRLQDIDFLEAEGNYTHIITKDSKYTLRYTLNDTLEKLKYAHFVRVHRSYAINMQHLDTFSDISVFVGEKELPLGRHYKEGFLRKFNFL